MPRGKLITFEGVEGSGKSTQLRHLSRMLRQRGIDHRLTREPGGTPLADRLRGLFHDPAFCGLSPLAELYLIEAARADHVARILAPALAAGELVFCDRFTDATLAYQGYGRGLSLSLVGEQNRQACGGLVPDRTFLFDLPAEVGLARARRRNQGDVHAEARMEMEDLEFHCRVAAGYRQLAAMEPQRISVIPADGSEEEVSRRLWAVFSKELP